MGCFSGDGRCDFHMPGCLIDNGAKDVYKRQGEIVTMFLGMLMGMPVVLLPIQILIVNLVTDGLPAIALGLEPAEKDIMQKPPRKKQEGIFSDGLLSTIVFRGILIGLTTLAVFTSFYHSSQNLVVARTCLLYTSRDKYAKVKRNL